MDNQLFKIENKSNGRVVIGDATYISRFMNIKKEKILIGVDDGAITDRFGGLWSISPQNESVCKPKMIKTTKAKKVMVSCSDGVRVFPSMSKAAEFIGVETSTVMRALVSGKAIRGEMVVSQSNDINKSSKKTLRRSVSRDGQKNNIHPSLKKKVCLTNSGAVTYHKNAEAASNYLSKMGFKTTVGSVRWAANRGTKLSGIWSAYWVDKNNKKLSETVITKGRSPVSIDLSDPATKKAVLAAISELF